MRIYRKEKRFIKTSSICADYYVTHAYEWFCESPYVFKELQETRVDFYDFPMQMLNWSARRYTIFYIFSDVSIFMDLRVTCFRACRNWRDRSVLRPHRCRELCVIKIKRLVIPYPLLIRSSLLERVCMCKKLWWITSACLADTDYKSLISFVALRGHVRKIFLSEVVFVSASDGFSCICDTSPT